MILNAYIEWPSYIGNPEIVKFLIEVQGCDPQCINSEGFSPLHLASRHGKFDVVKYLVTEQKSSIKSKASDGSVPLSLAIANDHAEILLQKEHKVYENQYLVHSACRAASVKFLANRFNPCIRDHKGLAPLHIACANGHVNVCKFLVEEVFCDPICKTSNAWTPLHSASQHGQLNIIRYLIEEQGCTPTCRTLGGATPLHLVCRHGHLDSFIYLMNKLSDTSLSPYYSDSLIKETLKGGNDDILLYLLSNGLKFSPEAPQLGSHASLVQPALKIFIIGNALSGKKHPNQSSNIKSC